jgi:hypothetical protein
MQPGSAKFYRLRSVLVRDGGTQFDFGRHCLV